jgi:RHS repeat-associated protein
MGQVGAQLDEVRTYNTFGELASIAATFNGVSLMNLEYPVRDKLGRIVQQAESVNNGSTTTIAYAYDAAGRLQDVTRNSDPSSSYTYDLNGNRQTAPGLIGTPEYDNQDRVRNYNGTTYDYTANGELLQKTTGGSAATTYQYDVFGNLRQATLPSGVIIDYTIDAANRRVGKTLTVGGNSTLIQAFVYDDQRRIAAELDATGTVRSRFVYGSRTNVPDYMVNNAGTYRILADHLGSPRLVVNVATGAIEQRIDYDEYGRATLVQGSWSAQPFGFAGGLYDADTKLVRFGVRDYDAETGRWTAKDPMLFAGGSTNVYEYVRGDPVNLIDPTGFTQADIDVAAEFVEQTQPDLGPIGKISPVLPDTETYAADYGDGEIRIREKLLNDNLSDNDQRNLAEDLIHEQMHAHERFWERWGKKAFGDAAHEREAQDRYNNGPNFDEYRRRRECPAP